MNRPLTMLVLVATSALLTGCATRAKQSAANPPPIGYVKAADVRLLFAAIKCDPNAMDAALKAGADVNTVVEGTGPPLVIMCGCDYHATELLLNAGADPNRYGTDGLTPLLAATLFNRKDVVKLLISKGADVNASTQKPNLDNEKFTPLMIAKKQGYQDLVQVLTEAGAKE